MPYDIRTYNGKHCIFKEGDSTPIEGGCHSTRPEAENHRKALYANEANKAMIKAISYDDIKDEIRWAIQEVYPTEYGPYIAELFDEYAIVDMDDMDYWQVPYAMDGDAVTLSDKTQWSKVKPKRTWIEAKAKWLKGQNIRPTNLTVKAIETDEGEWLLDVLGVPFGGPFDGKDSQGEFFDDATELWLDKIGARAIVHYHGFDLNGNPTNPEIIGTELGYEKKADGIWFKVLLDKTNETAKSLWQSAKNGFVKASSGALNHLVRPLTRKERVAQGGHIDIWPMGELSLVDTSKGINPINSYAVALPALRATFKAANIPLPSIFTEGQGTEMPGAETLDSSEGEVLIKSKEQPIMSDKSTPLTEERILQLLDERDKRKEAEAAQKALEAKAAKADELQAELDALKAEKAEAEKEATKAGAGKQQIKRLANPVPETPDSPDNPDITVYSKWDGFDLVSLGMAWDMLKAVKSNRPLELYRAMHAQAHKKARAGDFFKTNIVRNQRGEIVREFNPDETSTAVKAVLRINPMQFGEDAFKSNELHGSDVVDGGDEWVPVLWSAEMWDLVRNEAKVMSRFRQVEVAGESLTIPTLEGKTTVYKVAQTDSESELAFASTPAVSSKITTGNTTLTPVKNMAWVIWTGELDEDSIVPILSTLQMTMQKDIMETIDNILISGDTDTSSSNISDNGNGAIATTWHLLTTNGLRDYALGNSNASDRGALTADDFLTVMGLLGTNGAYALDPEKLFWVCDPGTYRTTLALGEALTRDKNSAATIESGRIMRMYGSDFFTSDQFALTDTSGYINNSGGSNTKGSFLLVRPDRWVIGFSRRIRIESPARGAAEIVADANHLVASYRFDFKTHSGGEGAALGYNITVL